MYYYNISTFLINEGLRLINIFFITQLELLNVNSIFYVKVYMNRGEIIRNVLYLEVGASLWRHPPPQQQHQGWRTANKWSDGNENSLYRNIYTVCTYAGYHYF